MAYNLGELPQSEKDKINVDQAASSVAYKERINLPVVPVQVEDAQPAHLREYFKERLQHYREVSKRFPSGSDIVYQNMREGNK